MVRRRVVIDHVVLVVSDLAASDRFYTDALAGVWVRALARNDVDGAVAYGLEGLDDFAIVPARDAPATTSAHVAFVAESREAVDAFSAAALAAGGSERAAPRVRDEYSPRHCAAYVKDPDGNNIEAVHHGQAARPTRPVVDQLDRPTVRARSKGAPSRRPPAYGLTCMGAPGAGPTARDRAWQRGPRVLPACPGEVRRATSAPEATRGG